MKCPLMDHQSLLELSCSSPSSISESSSCSTSRQRVCLKGSGMCLHPSVNTISAHGPPIFIGKLSCSSPSSISESSSCSTSRQRVCLMGSGMCLHPSVNTISVHGPRIFTGTLVFVAFFDLDFFDVKFCGCRFLQIMITREQHIAWPSSSRS